MPSKSRDRRYVNLPRKAVLPFSDGVLVGDTLYLAGRVGIDPETNTVPAEVDQELKLLFAGIEAVLTKAGMGFDDLVWVQVFSPDLSLWDRFNQEYLKHFSKDLPARAFLGSGALIKGARFEMLGIAVRSS